MLFKTVGQFKDEVEVLIVFLKEAFEPAFRQEHPDSIS